MRGMPSSSEIAAVRIRRRFAIRQPDFETDLGQPVVSIQMRLTGESTGLPLHLTPLCTCKETRLRVQDWAVGIP